MTMLTEPSIMKLIIVIKIGVIKLKGSNITYNTLIDPGSR